MAERQAFARVLLAADGYQVLFFAEIEPAANASRIVARTMKPDGFTYYQHMVTFDGDVDAADRLLKTIGQEEVEVIRMGALVGESMTAETLQ